MKIIAIPVAIFLLIGGIACSPVNLDLFRHIPELALFEPAQGVNAVDEITYALVDTSLLYLQLGKYARLFDYEGDLTLYDWVHNITRVNCENGACIQENVFVEMREPAFRGTHTINLTTNIQPTKFQVKLTLPEFELHSYGYQHTITNNVTGETKIGEIATFRIENAVYGLAADYKLDSVLGIQFSNVDITLNIGKKTWTVENRFSISATGQVTDEGSLTTDIGARLQAIWEGDYEGKPLEPQYEKWAEFVINCGLSGGKFSPECENIDVLRKVKFADFAAAM